MAIVTGHIHIITVVAYHWLAMIIGTGSALVGSVQDTGLALAGLAQAGSALVRLALVHHSHLFTIVIVTIVTCIVIGMIAGNSHQVRILPQYSQSCLR